MLKEILKIIIKSELVFKTCYTLSQPGTKDSQKSVWIMLSEIDSFLAAFLLNDNGLTIQKSTILEKCLLRFNLKSHSPI